MIAAAKDGLIPRMWSYLDHEVSYNCEDLRRQGEIHQLWPVKGGFTSRSQLEEEHKPANDLQKQELKTFYLVCTVD